MRFKITPSFASFLACAVIATYAVTDVGSAHAQSSTSMGGSATSMAIGSATRAIAARRGIGFNPTGFRGPSFGGGGVNGGSFQSRVGNRFFDSRNFNGLSTRSRIGSSGFSSPGRVVSSGFNTPGRVVSSGFGTPGRVVSSGFSSPGRVVLSLIHI